MRLPKKFTVCAMVCVLLGGQALGIQASSISTIQQQINQQQNALNQVNQQLNQYEAEREEYQSYLDDQKSEMINLMKDIVYYEEAIDVKAGAIAQAESDLEEAERQREEQYQAMLVHIQYMYERGDDSMLAMLLNSKSFAEMLNRAEYVDSLYEYDQSIVQDYDNLVKDIDTMKHTLEQDKIELEVQQKAVEEQKVELDRIMADLEDKISDYDTLVANAKSQAKAYKQQIASGQKQIEIIKKQQEEEARKALLAQQQQNAANASSGKTNTGNTSSGSSSSGSSSATVVGSGTGADIASYALQFVGNPYVWGGTSLTNGADCSGFIMAVYAQYGYSLPHSSYSMRSIGTGVSLSEAKAGDIICYSGHVALYIGDGKIVHAKNSNYGIVTDNVYYGWGGSGPTVLAVRRIIK